MSTCSWSLPNNTPNVDNGFLLLIHSFSRCSGDGWRNVTQNQFCVYITLWCNCLGSGQLLWLCEIDSEDAVTTGYSGVPKIILIIGLLEDSDGKWTISVHKAHKCAVITAEPSLAHSFCMKEHPTFEISEVGWKQHKIILCHSLWEQAIKVMLNKIHMVPPALNLSNGLAASPLCCQRGVSIIIISYLSEENWKQTLRASSWVTASRKLEWSQKGLCLPGGTEAPWW